ncbi:hypothetical protein P4S95_27235 [Aneurinibacillus aneurinilyticus]|uniref:hypothetical protein n=1 Tax=Aneurinibacillus aneurinilyticus TaxID=1391 RepID=UPI002E2130EF|nr:hypothetical protein [Aneurinibacillus aneurinilyticus]
MISWFTPAPGEPPRFTPYPHAVNRLLAGNQPAGGGLFDFIAFTPAISVCHER